MAGALGYKNRNLLKYFRNLVRILLVVVFAQSNLWSQDITLLSYTMQDVLAHNDYQKNQPFTVAYTHRVGILEADLYYQDGKIILAHDPSELKHGLDLEKIYLEPLKKCVIKYGRPYPESNHSLALMLDIKNKPDKILTWINQLVLAYPELFGSDTTSARVPIIISGARPAMDTWKDLPESVFIDGRLSDTIPVSLRSKVYMVSSSFTNVVTGSWTRDRLTPAQKTSVQKAIDQVHQQNLKVRFWGVPDNPYFWKLQSDLGVDIIGSDQLDELAKHLPMH